MHLEGIIKIKLLSIVMKARFVDLFSGMGGMRVGFQRACEEIGLEYECVFSCDIKQHAIDVYNANFGECNKVIDITQVDTTSVPDFDFLLGGFPCQPFSSAGKKQGFLDDRGQLIHHVLRFLRDKQPLGFILENVDNLEIHDGGKTLGVILNLLTGAGYHVSHGVHNSANFGVPQNRKRLYFLGCTVAPVAIPDNPNLHVMLNSVLETGHPVLTSEFAVGLYNLFKNPAQLHGKCIKDKRGGSNNIHSWDLGVKGHILDAEKELMELILLERRKRHWAVSKGIKWMDGMPLTFEEISKFSKFKGVELQNMLGHLVEIGYLSVEHPKDIVNGKRVPRLDVPAGYNITTGKLSFPLTTILDPRKPSPTLVATDVGKLGVVDRGGLRKLTTSECLKISGYPEDFQVPVSINKLYDLIGNTVTPPVITCLSRAVISACRDKLC